MTPLLVQRQQMTQASVLAYFEGYCDSPVTQSDEPKVSMYAWLDSGCRAWLLAHELLDEGTESRMLASTFRHLATPQEVAAWVLERHERG